MNCIASEYLANGYRLASPQQTGILIRCHDYSRSCRMWASNIATKPYAQSMDQLRVNDLAKMSATLAFLAFPDLRAIPLAEPFRVVPRIVEAK